MGVFDQAARFAAQAELTGFVQHLGRSLSAPLAFEGWFDTRSLPMPGGADRTADLVAIMNDERLLLIELQTRHDPDKLDVTLEEVGILRSRARHGEARKGKYHVLSALVYLTGRCPEAVLDMTTDGFGTRHAPLIWNVADDDAEQTLDEVASGARSWGLLFWVALMRGGEEETIISRWRDIVTATLPDRRMRGDLAGIALVFSELTGRRVTWKRSLEGFEMTESQVVNDWISEGKAEGKLEQQRQNLLELLTIRFPGTVPPEVLQLIRQQDDFGLLHDWFVEAARTATIEAFVAFLRR